MYSVSNLYSSIVASEDHWFEYKVNISGQEFSSDDLLSVRASYKAFAEERPVVGGCLAGELEVKILAPDVTIPRMAQVIPYVRATNGTQTSEWIPQGVFYIDTREVTHNSDGNDVLTFHCYDAMLKTETDYPATTHTWPVSDIRVAEEIASTIGASLDTRTYGIMTNAYSIGLPAGYSMREVLSCIAAMYAGNWVMTYDGALRLIALYELPPETNHLIDETYVPITFGGDYILV